jgi:DNA-binding MarR family transcriptional regulator
MIVKNSRAIPFQLDLAYFGFFLGLRVNELVLRRMTAAGFEGVRESHGYVIQHLIESRRSITELARRMGVTQQAASKTVAELISIGILEAASAKDRRSKCIRLSRRGWRAVRLGRRARNQIEQRLVTKVGKRSYAKAKATLLACLRDLGGIERIRSRRVRQPR